MIGVHISPSNALEELTALRRVYYSIRNHFNTEDIMILGNLNADCDAMRRSEIDGLEMRTPGFHWLIMDNIDTSVGESQCALDR